MMTKRLRVFGVCGFLVLGILACLTCTIAVAQEQGGEKKELARPLAALDLKDGDSIVFLGDSITHQRLYTQYVEDYLYTRFPHLRLKIHNAGVGGARAIDALDRFEKDVAAYKPKYVTILLGMNDGTYRAYDDTTFQTYQKDMTTLLDQIAGLGAVAIPMTPTMFDTRALHLRPKKDEQRIESTRLYNSVLAYYGGWLQEMAYERGLGYVDMYTPLNQITIDERKKDPSFTLIADAVHPGPDGQVVMATAVIEDLGLPRQVSGTVLSRAESGKWSEKVSGGTIEGIQGGADQVSFTLKAKALPWVLPEAAQLGSKLTKLGHRFSREALQVVGLSSGNYRLTIDGVDVGNYSNVELAKGIELQGNSKTPQYQQSLKVAELNSQRNQGPLGKLRAEWLKFQRYARAKRANDTNALPKLEEEIQGMDERVAAANAEAKAIEDQIFEVNQPLPRKYELTLVK